MCNMSTAAYRLEILDRYNLLSCSFWSGKKIKTKWSLHFLLYWLLGSTKGSSEAMFSSSESTWATAHLPTGTRVIENSVWSAVMQSLDSRSLIVCFGARRSMSRLCKTWETMHMIVEWTTLWAFNSPANGRPSVGLHWYQYMTGWSQAEWNTVRIQSQLMWTSEYVWLHTVSGCIASSGTSLSIWVSDLMIALVTEGDDDRNRRPNHRTMHHLVQSLWRGWADHFVRRAAVEWSLSRLKTQQPPLQG